MNYEYVYGIQPVLEVLRSKRRKVIELYVANKKFDSSVSQVLASAQRDLLPIKEVDREYLTKLSGQQFHQGLVIKAAPYPYAVEEEIMIQLQEKSDLFLLILDQIQDPQNLGAILRTAHCAGVDAVFIPERRSCEVTPLVQKVSAGASEKLSVVKAKNLARLIENLKEMPVWIYGADAASKTQYFEADYSGNVAWVMGNEGEGMRALTRQKCDVMVSIPLKGEIDSLNVSVATGVLLYEVLRQRHVKNRK